MLIAARAFNVVAMEISIPRLSVVIAARDASATIDACLAAACRQAGDECEVLVVDDCSRDATASIASRYNVKLIRLPEHRGVCAARNAGARAARAPFLLFLDSDVVPRDALFEEGLLAMTNSRSDALIGSYDDQPAATSIVSSFKNLAHHYFHQNSGAATTTFWGACGFIRRDVFLDAGGFDEKRYILPSIEDVELGARLVKRGVRIVIDPHLQVTHLKRWTLTNLLMVDITRRAIPWTLLGLETGSLPSNLNFSLTQRIASLVAVAQVVAIIAALFVSRSAWIVLGILILAAIGLNFGLFQLFYKKGGIMLAVCGFLLQQFYYLYSLIGLCAGMAIYLFRRNQGQTLSR